MPTPAELLRSVRAHNDIGPLDDGYQYFWVFDRGAFSAADLRVIADELDRLNKDHHESILEHFSKEENLR